MLVCELLPENLLWLECIIRFFIAMFFGFALGLERQLRLKVAGLRIYVIVAAGSALFTVVSLYGFSESDPSRIAAQIVTGIGFLGAGAILHRQNVVHGLTTAAGIWLTAALGMLVGAGMYLVALCATVLMILVQLFMHLPLPLFKEKHYNEIRISFKSPTADSLHIIKGLFEIKSFTEFKAERVDGDVVYNAVVHTKKQIDEEFINDTINNYTYIISIEKAESSRY